MRVSRGFFVCALPVCVVAALSVCDAQAALWDFEDIGPPGDSTPINDSRDTTTGKVIRKGALTSIQKTIDGVTVTITRPDITTSDPNDLLAFDVIANDIQSSKAAHAGLGYPGDPGDFHRTDMSMPHSDDPADAATDLDRNGRWENKAVDPFATYPNQSPLRISFESADPGFTGIYWLAMLLGDYSFDEDFLRLIAYDADGTGHVVVDGGTVPVDPASTDDDPIFTQKYLTFNTTMAGIVAFDVFAGEGVMANGLVDGFSMYLDLLTWGTTKVAPRDFPLVLAGEGTFGSEAAEIPAPLAAPGIIALGLPLLLRRRRRQSL